MLSTLYEKVLAWSKHPRATHYLALVSFIDASVFPISPNFMLFPMMLATSKKSFLFATITIVTSILGGLVGYALGAYAFSSLGQPLITGLGYGEVYQTVLTWVQQWGFWAVFLACLSPMIPYKIFTIGSGVMQLNLGVFLLASILGRSVRFYGLAWIFRVGVPKLEPFVRKTMARLS